MSSNNWHQIIFIRDGNNQTLYVDGVLVETRDSNGVGGTPTNPFFIGCVNNQHFMDAFIPMVHMYNRALTQDEITQNFNNGRVRFKI
jgi:hypothetical protein